MPGRRPRCPAGTEIYVVGFQVFGRRLRQPFALAGRQRNRQRIRHLSGDLGVRRALSILKAYKEQKERGRVHIGFASDPLGLDAEIVGILDR